MHPAAAGLRKILGEQFRGGLGCLASAGKQHPIDLRCGCVGQPFRAAPKVDTSLWALPCVPRRCSARLQLNKPKPNPLPRSRCYVLFIMTQVSYRAGDTLPADWGQHLRQELAAVDAAAALDLLSLVGAGPTPAAEVPQCRAELAVLPKQWWASEVAAAAAALAARVAPFNPLPPHLATAGRDCRWPSALLGRLPCHRPRISRRLLGGHSGHVGLASPLASQLCRLAGAACSSDAAVGGGSAHRLGDHPTGAQRGTAF